MRRLFNNVARQILDADVLVNGTAYQGKGQLVAVADTGFDQGLATNPHPAFTGRVAKLYALGRTSPAKADDPDGHGTHVGGIGSRATAIRPRWAARSGGRRRRRGWWCSAARLRRRTRRDSGRPERPVQPRTPTIRRRVHTNSWGRCPACLPYDASANEIDEIGLEPPGSGDLLRGRQRRHRRQQQRRRRPQAVGSQSAAKNCITVGASESLRPKIKATFVTYGDVRPSDFPTNPLKARSEGEQRSRDGRIL